MGGGDITRDAGALTDMMIGCTITTTGEIQGANHGGAEVMKTTGGETPTNSTITMEGDPK